MDIIEIINKKRLGKILSTEEIEYFVNGYVNGEIPDYQMSSLLMAIVLKNMTEHETVALTTAMLNSGDRMNLESLGNVVDKHSTGGVGDKTTMIVAPLVASVGVNVAKLSGKSLGYTGGTIDKLESIPGFCCQISEEKLINQIKKIGMVVASQTNNLVPADKKIYSLRDVTGTVESIPLIASSIMSKKIASGANKLVIDVKVGTGAFMKNIKDATRLAELMVKIGNSYGIEVVCLLTNMDVPLGSSIGNALEVKEVIEVLRDKREGNLTDLCIELASYMASLGLNISYEEAKEKVAHNLENGQAYQKFLEFVHEQGGDLTKLPIAKYSYQIKSNRDGYLTKMDALELGKLSTHLGAGRGMKNEKIDYGAGIVLHKNINDYVKKGEVLMTLYTSRDLFIKDIQKDIFTISKAKKDDLELIYKVVK